MERYNVNDNEINRNIFDYIALLEKTNEELVNALKQCMLLFQEIRDTSPKPGAWNDIIDAFQNPIYLTEQRII